MRHTTKIVLILALIAAACSDRGKETAPAESESPAQELSTPKESVVAKEVVDLAVPKELEIKSFQPWTGDLDGMVRRRLIRVLVVYSKTMYFVDKAEQKGLTYEVLKEFENYLNTKLKTGNLRVHVVFIPVGRDELIQGLVSGRGDIAAANLTITSERQASVDFSEPAYSGVSELVVTGPAAPPISSIDDLSGKEVYVRQSSSYYGSLKKLNDTLRKQQKPEAKIVTVSEYLETEDILEMVNAGLYPITVVDSHLAEFWAQVFDNIRVHPDLAVQTQGSIGWAFRKNSPGVQQMVNEFMQAHRKGTTFGNVLFKKYLRNTKWVKNNTSESERRKFEGMVEFFKTYARQYDFKYLLMVAQGYQESGLDQNRKSHVGAVGVMQLLPSTAADRNVNIPGVDASAENNIHAGIKYMRFMMNHYFKNEPMDELNKHLFAFASYNAGPGRVAGLRKKASKKGLDPNKWFNHVEVVAAEEVGRETVQYVSNIYKYYLAYEQIFAAAQKKEKARATAKD